MPNAAAQQLAPIATPHRALRSIDITVADIGATIAYYGAVMPLRTLRSFTIPSSRFGTDLVRGSDSPVEIAVISTPTAILNLMQFGGGVTSSTPPPVTGPGYTHMCIQSPASDPGLPKLMAQGLTMVSRCDERGVDIGGYGVRYAYGRDPEGRMLEIEILDRPSRPDTGWITHIANVAHDHAVMMDFYRRLLDVEPYRTTEQSGRDKLDDVAGIDGIAILGGWFRVHNLEIEVWSFTSPGTPAPQGRRHLDAIGYNAFALEVSDLDAESLRLAALGVELIGPEVDFGGWRCRYAADPEGNLFSVQQRVSAPITEAGEAFGALRH